MSKEHELDAAIRRYWEGDGHEDDAGDVLDLALTYPPSSPTVLARALAIAHRTGADTGGYAEQVEEKLGEPMARMRELLKLIDMLGDSTLDVDTVVFDHLADAWLPEDSLAGVDTRALQQARLGAESRPQAARALLEELGWERFDKGFAERIRISLDALEDEAQRHHSRVLLVTPAPPVGLALGVKVLESDESGVIPKDAVDLAMNKQAHTVLDTFASSRGGVSWSLEWPLRYEGESIGLALQVAALVSFRSLRRDPLLAATGRVEDGGEVRFVHGIAAKLLAARDAGYQRILLPRENEDEARAAGVDADLQLLFIENISDIERALTEVPAANEMSFDGLVRKAKAALPRFGLSLSEEKQQQHSRQLIVTDASGRAILEVWSTGKVTAGGPSGATKDQVRSLVDDVFVGEAPQEREARSFMLADAWRQQHLREELEREGAEAREVTGNAELFRYDLRRKSSKAQVTMWTSGKGRVMGTAPAFDDVVNALGRAQEGLANVDVVPKPKSKGPPGGNHLAELPTEGPWIGTDESGKGDYFGPLVSAAVFADEDVADRLRELGVQDSKKLTDKRVHALAPQVREVVGKGRYKVTTISPRRYNELYSQFKSEGKNLNSLLAWGHTRSIEDLLGNGLRPRYAIVDQFADARYIQQRLMAEARESRLQVFQFPKAESDLAVAAASILARVEFLDWLAKTSAQLGITLPKGASPQVTEVAKQIAATGGRDALTSVAKLHFKTTQTVLAA